MDYLGGFSWVDALAAVWFLCLWIGYAQFAKYQAKKTECLSSVLHRHRVDWMKQLLQREQRVSDAALLSNLERNVSFLASTSILVVAGLLTALAGAEQVQQTLKLMVVVRTQSLFEVELKLFCLISVFIYAYFTFSWSLRQFGFVSILIGSAPAPISASSGEVERVRCQQFASSTAKVLDQAGHSFNYGLRSYYFALAMLSWFISPWLMLLAAAAVVAVLYGREFHSSTLRSMQKIGLPN